MADSASKLELVQDDELEIEVGEYPPLLDCTHVEALCKAIRKVTYWYARIPAPKYIFLFVVDQPPKYHGIELEMHVNLKWKTEKPPKGSKLKKLTHKFCPATRFAKKYFVGKMFLCRLKKTKGDAPYTDIETLERLAEKLLDVSSWQELME